MTQLEAYAGFAAMLMTSQMIAAGFMRVRDARLFGTPATEAGQLAGSAGRAEVIPYANDNQYRRLDGSTVRVLNCCIRRILRVIYFIGLVC